MMIIVLASFYGLITKSKPLPVKPSPTGVFPTTIIPETSTEDLVTTDQNWGKKAQEIENAYPWLDQLPLTTDEYFVYFDITKKTFIAKIYTKEIDKTKAKISDDLAKKGIDLSKYSVEWKLLP